MQVLLVLRKEGALEVRKTKYGLDIIEKQDEILDVWKVINENTETICELFQHLMERIEVLEREVNRK